MKTTPDLDHRLAPFQAPSSAFACGKAIAEPQFPELFLPCYVRPTDRGAAVNMRISKEGLGNVQAKNRLRPARKNGPKDAGGNGAVSARRHTAAGKLGYPRPCARVLLVFRRLLAQHFPQQRHCT